MMRVYCDGSLSKALLKRKLTEGYVLADLVRGGHANGDVAYFRKGTPEELEKCSKSLENKSP